MGPNSLPPLVAPPKRSTNVWFIVALVFISGLGAGVFIPTGMTLVGFGETQVVSTKKEPLTMPLPNGGSRRLDPPAAHQHVAAAPVAKVAKVEKADRKKFVVAAKKHKKAEKIEVKAVAKVEETPAPAAELIEEVASAPTVLQVEKMIQNNNAPTKGKAVARMVSLPPSQSLAPNTNLATHSLAPLPMLKTDSKSEAKTYSMTINNASFSKATLANCSKRCALIGTDAMGNPIKAVFDSATYASALLQHNGTINISGQPRIIKNQQVLVVENITFNLSATPKALAGKRPRAANTPNPVSEKGGYTEVSFENDDLKPGTVIKNRKQIPIEDQQEIPAP